MGTVITDVVRRVWKESEGIEVLPDDMNMVIVTNHGQSSEDYFGKIYLHLAPDVARAVALAMLECANELEKKQ